MSDVRRLTAAGAGAIAVVLVRGARALERLALLSRAPLGPVGSIRVTRFQGSRGELDEVLLVRTEEETVEVHLTGSVPLVEEVLEHLREGAEEAAGPVTIEEQAEALLALARSEAAARILLDQSRGALRRELVSLRERADDPAFGARLAALIERGERASFALEPRRVVLAGPVNAGKSTLFNLLLGEERVIVSEEAGTTRDAIVEHAELGAWPVELVDTAGIRPLAGLTGAAEVERMGRERGARLARAADLVLWLRPRGGDEPPVDLARDARLRVLQTMSDRHSRAPRACAEISSLAWPEHARESVHALFRDVFDLPVRAWEPGAAVPFTTEARGRLRALAETTAPAGRELALAVLLGGAIATPKSRG